MLLYHKPAHTVATQTAYFPGVCKPGNSIKLAELDGCSDMLFLLLKRLVQHLKGCQHNGKEAAALGNLPALLH